MLNYQIKLILFLNFIPLDHESKLLFTSNTSQFLAYPISIAGNKGKRTGIPEKRILLSHLLFSICSKALPVATFIFIFILSLFNTIFEKLYKISTLKLWH
jgi:hypothetical protein